MGLKSFHLVFIALSIVLAAFLAAWAVAQYRVNPADGYIATAAVSLGGAAALAVYLTAFRRKTKQL